MSTHQIKALPLDERPREKLLHHGAHFLTDAELLAIFIHTGCRGQSAIDISRDLLSRFGGLRQVLTTEQHTLCAQVGMGPAKYALLQASREIGSRFLKQKIIHQGRIADSKQVVEFLTHQLRDQPHEIFAILYLDTRYHILHYEELFRGTIDGAAVHPREVIKNVLRYNAAAVILAHNHPSGIAEPSQSDKLITSKLGNALSHIDVKLLDHIIIGNGEYTSMAEQGMLI